MIVSLNPEPKREEFDLLLENTLVTLQQNAKNSSKKLLTLTGRKIESYIGDILSENAINTPFENSIEVIGGHKFPDIVASKYYGVEVKTTTQNHWRTAGNSVTETTRIEDVERIFLLFAKLATPIEFRIRPYEEVLSGVVVTHSPRYSIDMNLAQGKTIFDKINKPYDEFRTEENPIKIIVDYYRKQLKDGEELWWINSDEETPTSNVILRIWNNLPLAEAQELRMCAMVFFPEMFGNSRHKFSRFALWLVTNHSVVCPNVRDLFTSGGKQDYIIGNTIYKQVPRVFLNLFENYQAVLQVLKETSAGKLSKYWKIKTTEQTKIADWQSLILVNSKTIKDSKHIDIEAILAYLYA